MKRKRFPLTAVLPNVVTGKYLYCDPAISSQYRAAPFNVEDTMQAIAKSRRRAHYTDPGAIYKPISVLEMQLGRLDLLDLPGGPIMVKDAEFFLASKAKTAPDEVYRLGTYKNPKNGRTVVMYMVPRACNRPHTPARLGELTSRIFTYEHRRKTAAKRSAPVRLSVDTILIPASRDAKGNFVGYFKYTYQKAKTPSYALREICYSYFGATYFLLEADPSTDDIALVQSFYLPTKHFVHDTPIVEGDEE